MAADYQYKHTLDRHEPNLADKNSTRAHVLRAAFRLADLAHAGESRDKIKDSVMYISHPLMAYEILVRLGESDDPALLASAFLHDVLELPHYRDDPERLQRELLVELEKEGLSPKQAEQYAADIYQLVYQVTNPKELPKVKELYQIDSIDRMCLRAKKLKIVDQAASLICNLHMANDPREIPYDKERAFKEKAETLMTNIIASVQHKPDEKQAIDPYDQFGAHTCVEANKLFLSPKASAMEVARTRKQVRRDFTFESVFSAHPKRSLLPRENEAKVAEHYYLYDPLCIPDELDSGRPLGLMRVDLNAEGKVVKFYMHVSPLPGDEVKANQLQRQFTHEIRERLRWGGFYSQPGKDQVQQGVLRPGDLAIDDSFRVYHLNPAMRADAFAAAAVTTKVCSRAAALEIKKISDRLQLEHAKNGPQR